MKDQPMVTISMPCYNHEKYIRESIESVLAQTYQDFELVIVENGSTDHCRDIIREYEGRVTVFYFDENNQDKAAKLFLQETRGKYHAIMTSDDIWMPDKLEKQIDFLEKHPEYQACFTWAEYGDEDMNTLYDDTYTLFKKDNRTNAEWLNFFWKNGNCLCAPSMVMRSQTFRDIMESNIPYWQLYDFEELVRFLLRGNQFWILDEVLVKMRKHATAISYTEHAYARQVEEISSIRLEIMEQISDELFCRAFGTELVRLGCTDHDELICEKILLMFRYAQNTPELQPRAFDYFYKHYSDNNIAEIFKEKYFLNKKYFIDMSTQMGVIHTANQYYLMGYKAALEENRKR